MRADEATLPRPTPALLWAGGAVAAGALATAGLAPLALIGLPLAAACLVGVLGSPLAFLWILVAISGLGFGWADGAALELGGRTINVSGLRWGLALAASTAILFRGGVPRLPRSWRPYLALVALAAAGIVWTPDRFEGLKNLLQYAGPLLIGLVALGSVRSEADVAALRTAFWVGLVAGAATGLVPALAGEPLGGSFDPGGRLLHRGFATYLLPLMALALAGLRYRAPGFAALAAAIFALTLATLSRTTIAAMLLLGLVAFWGKSMRLRVGALLFAGLLAAAALGFEPLRERIFAGRTGFRISEVQVTGSGDAATLELGGLQTSGRGVIWLLTWRNAMRSPWIGNGTGSATSYLEKTAPGGIAHPHNDYLRVFHDLGALGLLVLFGAAAALLARTARLHRTGRTALARETALAAGLAWTAYLVVAVFDNGMIYFAAFTQNVFILLALAERAGHLEPDAGEGG